MSVGNDVTRNSSGIDLTFASTLIGHHVLVVNLLKADKISENGRIIIAGSEASRGDAPGIKLPDFDKVAKENFRGNMHDTFSAIAKAEYPKKYVAMNAYGVAKLFVVWWVASLSKKLEKGITINAISPGSVVGTNFVRNMSWGVRNILAPIIKTIGPLMGMDGSVSTAAKRYLEASHFDKNKSGMFFASPPKKMVGKLQEQHSTLFQDQTKQKECYDLVVEFADGIGLAPY